MMHSTSSCHLMPWYPAIQYHSTLHIPHIVPFQFLPPNIFNHKLMSIASSPIVMHFISSYRTIQNILLNHPTKPSHTHTHTHKTSHKNHPTKLSVTRTFAGYYCIVLCLMILGFWWLVLCRCTVLMVNVGIYFVDCV